MKPLLLFVFFLFTPLTHANEWATGPKRVLVIRVDFSDQVDTRPFSFFANVMAEVRVAYRLDSYRRTDLITTMTPMLRMPKTAANYSYWDDWSIHNDAWAAAVTHGYAPDSYDRVIMHWQSLRDFPGSNMKWIGYGQVGGRYIWLNGWFNFKAVSHELGHTYGNWHAGRMVDGKSVARGDPFDIMGWGRISESSDFNPYFKERMGWIEPGQVRTVGAGVYRLYRFDHEDATGLFGLRVGNLLVTYRRAEVDLKVGALIARVGMSNTNEFATLDMNPGTNSMLDSTLDLGQTYNDTASNYSVSVVGMGGSAPHQYLDVQVID